MLLQLPLSRLLTLTTTQARGLTLLTLLLLFHTSCLDLAYKPGVALIPLLVLQRPRDPEPTLDSLMAAVEVLDPDRLAEFTPSFLSSPLAIT